MWKAQVWLIRCAQSCNEFLFWVGECVNEGRERKICKWLLLWTRDGGWENQQTLNLALRVSLDIRTRKMGRSYPSLSLILTKPKWEFFFSRLCLPNDKQGKKG